MNKGAWRMVTAMFLLSLASGASAHAGGAAAGGLAAGLLHPLLGPDHLLALLAVGIWAASVGGRTAWLAPALFLACMAGAAGLSAGGVALPGVEGALAVSVLALGLLLIAAVRRAASSPQSFHAFLSQRSLLYGLPSCLRR